MVVCCLTESPVAVVNARLDPHLMTFPNVASTFRSFCLLHIPGDECTAREEEAEALAEARGWEHRLAQERMDQELQDLNKKLEEKEVRSLSCLFKVSEWRMLL
jgi:hypothetical protein